MIEYALRNRISLVDIGWRARAKEAIAREYILKLAEKRKQGRPKEKQKGKSTGLLGVLVPPTTELDMVENLSKMLKNNGIDASDAEIAKFIVLQTEYGGNRHLDECEFVFARVPSGKGDARALLQLHQQAKKLGKELIARALQNCREMPEMVLLSLDSLSDAALNELIAITELRLTAAASEEALQ